MAAKRLSLDVDYIVDEYLAGKSEYALSKELGVSRDAIRLRLIERGVTPRSWSEAQKIVWARRTAEERARQVAAAHDASRGNPNSFKALCAAAKTRQKRRIGISAREQKLVRLLEDRGMEFVQQLAIGPYNCDVAIHPVAVEVFGGHWHWYGDHLAKTAERFSYIMDQGWHILVISQYGGAENFPIDGSVADYVITYVEEARSNPASIREYRVVRGAGELIAAGRADDDEVSIIPTFTARRDPVTGQYQTVPR